ncbi:rhodopsin [Natrinema sp. CBA1119]|uniref:bacteriorhodopsin n=1 Tax=Natrinema sp. CBA1119 TaxID=1608465 RepID=UPI000BF3C768|nr:bacteriorhodopsin [Natrinema sp. CBA1119]PGF16134.1 rhodopsin [Natrinema sp. CBA1119]
MIPELQLYRIAFYAMVAATVGFLVWIARMPAGKRRYYLPVPIICGTLALANFGMSAELFRITTAGGDPIPMSRYVDYTIATPIMVIVAGLIAGATRRQLAALVVLSFVWVGTSAARYLVDPTLAAVMNGVTIVSLIGIVSLMLWPITKRSGEQSGERVLLYGKLRNLLLLLWVFYLVMGFVSRQGLGLLDAFGGIFVVSYLDILTRIGFGVLVLRATDATDQVIESLKSPEAGDDGSDGVTLERSDDTAVDPAD